MNTLRTLVASSTARQYLCKWVSRHCSMVVWDAGFAGYIHDCSASVAYYCKGHPLRSEDIPFPRPNRWWEEAAALITMQLVFGCDSPNHPDSTLQRTSIPFSILSFKMHAIRLDLPGTTLQRTCIPCQSSYTTPHAVEIEYMASIAALALGEAPLQMIYEQA